MKLSVIIPAYNEQDNIELFYTTFSTVFRAFKDDYELIFIDDGSNDNTLKEIKKLHKENSNVKAISFSRNFGKEAAMYAGLNEAVGEYVAFIDADLQQRPDTLLEMMNILDTNEDYDSVVAYQGKRNEGCVLSFFKRAFYWLINKISDVKFRQGASDFRIVRRNVANAIIEMKEYFRFSKGIFSWVGFNTYYMEYIVEKRANGKTKWSFIKLFQYALEGIISFTTLPLRLPIVFGLLLLLVAFILLIISINIQNELMILISVLLLLFGLQFIFLGVFGEYLSKTYIENKHRPIYIIKEKIQ